MFCILLGLVKPNNSKLNGMRLLILVLFLGVFAQVNGQYNLVKLEDALRIKESTLIIAEHKSPELTADLRAAMEEFWTFSDITAPLSLSDALKRAKANHKYLVLELSSISSKSLNAGEGKEHYRIIREGTVLQIRSTDSEPLAKIFIPAFGDDKTVTKEALFFGVSTLQYMLTTMEKKEMKNNFKFQYAYKEKSPNLMLRTLLIAEGWAESSLSTEKLRELYHGPAEVVTYKEWRDAILTRKAGYAYAIIVPFPHGDGYKNYHQLVDAETGTVFGMALPADANMILEAGEQTDNMGYINKGNVPAYADILDGDW